MRGGQSTGQLHSSPRMKRGNKSTRSRLIIQSVDHLDKDELGRIQDDLENLAIEEMELDDDDDRDRLILKLHEVNKKLIEKLERLEAVVSQTVEKANETSKRSNKSHRQWESTEDDKQVQKIQHEINGHKKTISGLKLKLQAISSADRLVELRNHFKDSERRKEELEVDVATMERNIRHQQKYLNQMAGDADYETKIKELKEQLADAKENYKQTIRDHKNKDDQQKIEHEKMISLEEEHAKLK